MVKFSLRNPTNSKLVPAGTRVSLLYGDALMATRSNAGVVADGTDAGKPRAV